MTKRWHHERSRLADIDPDEDGIRRGQVELWWYGDAEYPRRDDPQVWVEAAVGPEGGQGDWTYMVEDAWDLGSREQFMTRERAVRDARERVELYRERVD